MSGVCDIDIDILFSKFPEFSPDDKHFYSANTYVEQVFFLVPTFCPLICKSDSLTKFWDIHFFEN